MRRNETEKTVAVAEVARPHGVRGELKLRVFNEESGVLGRGAAVTLALPSGARREVRFASVREVPGGLLVTLAGVVDREGAEALRGAQVEVPRASLEPAADGEFYFCDVEGCDVFLGDERIGSVERVVSYPTCDCLLVAKAGGGRVEVPLTDGYVAKVDVAALRIELASLEGL